MDAPLLSVCLIVRDEESRIGPCLAAAAPLADEIVVADTGSTDRTVEIAREHGARIVDVPWTDDFAAARNGALAAARGAWVLFVDADEQLERTDRAALRRRLQSAREPAFTVEVVSPRGGGRVEIAHLVRLFRRDPAVRYEGRIHESVLGSLCRLLGRETWTPPRSGLRLAHEGYTPELRAARGKHDRNRRLLLAEIERRPDEPGLRFLFARENVPQVGGDLLDLPEAREAYAILAPAADALAGAQGHGLADPAVTLAARLAVLAGDRARAAAWLDTLRARAGSTARVVYAEGELFLAAGRFDRAVRAFDAARRAPEGCETLPTEREMRGPWAALRAALAGWRAGDARALSRVEGRATEERLLRALVAASSNGPAAALAVLAEAVRDDANDPRAWWAMGTCFAGLGDGGRARAMMETALRAAPGLRAAEAFLRDGELVPPAGLLANWPL